MGKLFVIMGKSSTGKDTIYKRLKNEMNIDNIVMYTTRPMREGEKEGQEYFFTNEEKVKEYEKKGLIIELRSYNTVHGIWKYFTVADGQIEPESNKNYLVIATLEAYNNYTKYYGKEVVIPIYIEVNDKDRIHRAVNREDSEKVPRYAEMCRRFLADEKDFSEEKIIEAGINKKFINDNLDYCVMNIKKFINEMN